MMLYYIYSSIQRFVYCAGEDLLLPSLTNMMGEDKVMLLVILASIGFFMILYFSALFKHRKEKLHEAYLTEQRISKKIHDEISSELYCTINQLEATPVISGNERDHLIEKLNSIYTSTRDLSRETAAIDTGMFFPQQLKAMISGFRNHETNVIVKGADLVRWSTINEIIKVTLYRVMQELMINMKKHSGANVIILEFTHNNKTLTIKYKDNGKGLSDQSYNKNGLANVENRMETIGGTATFEKSPEKGLRITLSFPASTPYV